MKMPSWGVRLGTVRKGRSCPSQLIHGKKPSNEDSGPFCL